MLPQLIRLSRPIDHEMRNVCFVSFAPGSELPFNFSWCTFSVLPSGKRLVCTTQGAVEADPLSGAKITLFLRSYHVGCVLSVKHFAVALAPTMQAGVWHPA